MSTKQKNSQLILMTTLSTTPLTGKQLAEAVKQYRKKGVSETDIIERCGYAYTTSNGQTRLKSAKFYRKLTDALLGLPAYGDDTKKPECQVGKSGKITLSPLMLDGHTKTGDRYEVTFSRTRSGQQKILLTQILSTTEELKEEDNDDRSINAQGELLDLEEDELNEYGVAVA